MELKQTSIVWQEIRRWEDSSVPFHLHLPSTNSLLTHTQYLMHLKMIQAITLDITKLFGLKHLAILRLDFHFNHCCFIFSGIGWSHWKLSLQNYWIVFLPFHKNGDTSPKGSNIELNMANNPLLVKSLSIISMLKQSTIISISQNTHDPFFR